MAGSERQIRSTRSSLLPEHARSCRRALPIEIFVMAGPAMDLGLADTAIVTAGAFMAVLLACRGVVDPATRAGELFNRPYALGHAAAFSFGIGLVDRMRETLQAVALAMVRVDPSGQCSGRELMDACGICRASGRSD